MLCACGMGFDKLKVRFDYLPDIELRADLDSLADDLCVVAPLRRDVFEFDLVIYAIARGVIREAIQRVLTGVETALTELCLVFLVGLAFLELEAPARHVLVESFVVFCHVCSPFVFCGFCHPKPSLPRSPPGTDRRAGSAVSVRTEMCHVSAHRGGYQEGFGWLRMKESNFRLPGQSRM